MPVTCHTHRPSWKSLQAPVLSLKASWKKMQETSHEMPWLKKQLDFHQIRVAGVTNLVRFHFILAKFNHWCWTLWPFLGRFPSSHIESPFARSYHPPIHTFLASSVFVAWRVSQDALQLVLLTCCKAQGIISWAGVCQFNEQQQPIRRWHSS